jgi:hypothetical protein
MNGIESQRKKRVFSVISDPLLRFLWESSEWYKRNIQGEKTNGYNFAKRELDILEETTPDSVVTPFRKEILALCEAFGKSGQSGGSAPYTASAISRAINKLLLHIPVAEITGNESEWVNIREMMGETMWQNSRCGGLFKYSDGKCSYNDAIVWSGEEEYDTFTGRVYADDKEFELVSSSQFVKFPFTPKTFYVDVVRVPITKEEAEERNLHYIEHGIGECYYTVVKDPKQLEEVFNYYEKRTNSSGFY